MGDTVSHLAKKFKTRKSGPENMEIEPFPGDIPLDIVEYTLTFLPVPVLVHTGRLVCKEWRDIIDQPSFWKIKCDRRRDIIMPDIPLKYLDFTLLFVKNPYGKNLVKNWNAEEGESGLAHWTHKHGGSFQLESPPQGSDPIPDAAGCRKCIAMSYMWFEASQTIDLWAGGCSPRVLDNFQPDIHVSIWVAARYDCGVEFQWTVRLYKDTKELVDEYSTTHQEAQWAGRAWTKLEHSFSGYGPGVQYVEITNAGRDTQYWAGFFGPKIAAPSVQLTFTK